MDGIRLGERKRSASTIALDEMAIGGRLYSNDPAEPPHVQGFFSGDIALVLLYDRALPDEEKAEVEKSLFARLPGLNALESEVLAAPPRIL